VLVVGVLVETSLSLFLSSSINEIVLYCIEGTLPADLYYVARTQLSLSRAMISSFVSSFHLLLI